MYKQGADGQCDGVNILYTGISLYLEKQVTHLQTTCNHRDMKQTWRNKRYRGYQIQWLQSCWCLDARVFLYRSDNQRYKLAEWSHYQQLKWQVNEYKLWTMAQCNGGGRGWYSKCRGMRDERKNATQKQVMKRSISAYYDQRVMGIWHHCCKTALGRILTIILLNGGQTWRTK